MVYLPTLGNVGKYTSPMDPMGLLTIDPNFLDIQVGAHTLRDTAEEGSCGFGLVGGGASPSVTGASVWDSMISLLSLEVQNLRWDQEMRKSVLLLMGPKIRLTTKDDDYLPLFIGFQKHPRWFRISEPSRVCHRCNKND